MLKLSLLISTIFLLQYAHAEDWVYVRPEIGIGYSDNAYQDDFNKKADSFTWLQTAARYELSDSTLTGYLNLRLFSKEDSNNSLNYSLRRKSKLAYENLDLTLGLGGFSYFKSDVGSTDEAFTNFYLTAFVTKKYQVSKDFLVRLEPGTKVSSYPQIENRLDLISFLRVDAAWDVQQDLEISPYFELGFLFSNKAYYARNYVDVGISLDDKLSQLYKFNIDLMVRNSGYPNRKVSQILDVPNRSGRVTSKSFDANESISLMQLSTMFVRTDEDRQLSVGLNYTNETSLSQLEHYKETQVFVSAMWTF